MNQGSLPTWLNSSRNSRFSSKLEVFRSVIDTVLSTPKIILISLLLIVLGLASMISGAYLFISSIKPVSARTQQVISDCSETDLAEDQMSFTVDIGGAVSNPGVYTISSQGRVESVIKAAGGFADEADQDYIARQLNLATSVIDQQKIYIPFESERDMVQWCQQATQAMGDVASVQTKSVSINTAIMEELTELAGIGTVRAQAIIDNRPYNTTAELVQKSVLTQNQFEKIVSEISL